MALQYELQNLQLSGRIVDDVTFKWVLQLYLQPPCGWSKEEKRQIWWREESRGRENGGVDMMNR